MRTAIIGGGAAGFFLAINLKEMMPAMEVTIFEKSKKVLAKVEVSGGGRCNCTNSFEAVSDLSQVYPRGHRLMKRLFKTFNYRDAYAWFENHGVRLVTQEDECVFPASQDSHTIINLFVAEARRHGTASLAGVPTIEPIPSLFTFTIADEALRGLMGTVVEAATAYIPGTNFKASGPLLITHWGMSGPAILKLSSYAARELHDHQYQMPLAVNWCSEKDAAVQQELQSIVARHPQKQLATIRPFNLPSRLWSYLLEKTLGERAQYRWQHLTQKDLNRLTNCLCNDNYQIAGRAAFKDEFVTCGGVSLSSVDPNTLESKHLPRVFFAGEVLDIDGVTGGFNFQAAWTTAYVVAQAIARHAD